MVYYSKMCGKEVPAPVKKLWKYMKSYRKEAVIGPLFKLFEALFDLMIPLVMAQIIDVGIGGKDTRAIAWYCAALVGLGIAGLAFALSAQYFAAKAAVGFCAQIKSAVFAKLNGLSFSEIDTLGTSSMITRMTSDVNQLQSGVNLGLRLLSRSPLVVFGALVMALTIDAKAAAVIGITIAILLVVVFGIIMITIPLYQKVQGRLDRVVGTTRENLTGVRVIRAFCKEEEEMAAFEERHTALTKLQIFVGRISGLMNPLTYVIINLATVVLIYVGALQVDGGILTQGAVVALYNYMAQILVELIKLANLIITLTKSAACARRISSVLDMQSTLAFCESDEKAGDPFIAFDGVSLTYQNAGDETLTDISFTLDRGKTLGIIGPTGSGKTSLVHLIPHFYDVTKGQVRVGGKDVRSYPLDELRERIGIVMQKAVLFRGTIRDNMQWRKESATDEEIWQALELAQAADVVRSKGGLDAPVEQEGRNFSGGQRQRLTIARALVGAPEILILDDSASALDYATDAALRQAIRSLPHEPTVIIVSQRTASIRFADRIVVLDDGEMVGIGTHDELLSTCSVYKEIYDSQFAEGEGAK